MTTRHPKLQVRTLVGITQTERAALRNAGISALSLLLDRRHSVDALAGETAIDPDRLTRWVAHADLCRIPRIGTQYAALLYTIGITSPSALARADAAELHTALHRANEQLARPCRQIPRHPRLQAWIDTARSLLDSE